MNSERVVIVGHTLSIVFVGLTCYYL